MSSDVENVVDDARRAFLASGAFRLCGGDADAGDVRTPENDDESGSDDGDDEDAAEFEANSASAAEHDGNDAACQASPSAADGGESDHDASTSSSTSSAATSMQNVPTDARGYLTRSPLLVLSERERVCETLWRRVFRLVFVRI